VISAGGSNLESYVAIVFFSELFADSLQTLLTIEQHCADRAEPMHLAESARLSLIPAAKSLQSSINFGSRN